MLSDGSTLLSTCSTRSPRNTRAYGVGHFSPCGSAQADHDQESLLCGHDDGLVGLGDLPNGRYLRKGVCPGWASLVRPRHSSEQGDLQSCGRVPAATGTPYGRLVGSPVVNLALVLLASLAFTEGQIGGVAQFNDGLIRVERGRDERSVHLLTFLLRVARSREWHRRPHTAWKQRVMLHLSARRASPSRESSCASVVAPSFLASTSDSISNSWASWTRRCSIRQSTKDRPVRRTM